MTSYWIFPLLTAVLGIAVGIILEKFKNRTVYLKFRRSVFPFATSMQHNLWGHIRVIFNDRDTKHLSLITVEIKNDSNIDLENVRVDFWVDELSQMLTHQANYIESGNMILLEEKYQDKLKNIIEWNQEDTKLHDVDSEHKSPTELVIERRWVLGNKVFMLPVFNRNTSVKFQILSENFNGDLPVLSLSVLHKSCKLLAEDDATATKRKMEKQAGLLWIILTSLTILVMQFKFRNYEYAVLWTGILTFASIYVAIGLYHLIKLLKRFIQ